MTSKTTTRLKHLCREPATYGLGIPADAYSADGIRLIRTSDITDEGDLIPPDQGVLVEAEPVEGYELQDGDLLFSRSGTLGRSLLYNRNQHGPCTFAQYLVRFRPLPEVDPRFIFYFSKSQPFQDQVNLDATQSTIANFNAQRFSNLELPSQSPGEQRAIANLLDRETTRIDSLIRTKEKLLDVLQRRWLAEVFHAITGGLAIQAEAKPSGLDWAGDIPEHWTVEPVYANYEVQLGKMLNPTASAGQHQAPYLRNVNIQWDRLELDDLASMSFDPQEREKFRLQPGDLLVCEGGEVGKAAIWNGELEECYYQKAVHRVRVRGPQGDTRFLMYCLWAAASMKVFEVEGNQSTILHLTAEKLREHRFPTPPKTEAAAIVKAQDDQRRRLTHLMDSIRDQMQLLREHRSALITHRISG